MSSASRRAKAAARAAANPIVPAPAAMSDAGFGMGIGDNGHHAVDYSRLRAWVYFPQLDTRREITPYTRVEVMRKARWFCVNHGFPRRIIFGLSRLAAGTGLSPHPLTDDKEWNADALKYANSRFCSPMTFDVGGRYDFYGAQPFVLAASYRDGDQSTVLTESASRQSMFQFFEGHQVGSRGLTVPGVDAEGWCDGVLTDANNRAIAYRYINDDGTYVDVAAEDVLFTCNYERAGQSRDTSILEPACNHLHDATDILSFLKTGVKLTNLMGYWFEKDPQQSPQATPFNSGAQRKLDIGGGRSITLEQIIGGGAIPDLPPGMRLKFNSSQHPHPNNLNLIDYLIRDISWGAGVSPELLWNIAALGGANTRFVLADAQSWIEKEQEKLVRLFCQRAWVYTIAKGIKSRALRPCRDPQWWKVGWIPPPRLTVDFGRDGKLYIEQHKSVMLTLKTTYGWLGQDWEPHVDQWLDELAYFKTGMEKRGLGWDDVAQWRNSAGNVRLTETGDDPANMGDGLPADRAEAAAMLGEIAKDPKRAQALLTHLSAQPTPQSL